MGANHGNARCVIDIITTSTTNTAHTTTTTTTPAANTTTTNTTQSHTTTTTTIPILSFKLASMAMLGPPFSCDEDRDRVVAWSACSRDCALLTMLSFDM